MASYSKELEAAARQRGFKNATEMVLWDKQRSQRREPQTTSAKGTPSDKAKKKPESSGGMAGFFEGLSRVLDRASKK
jgi:hypothetical protein